MDELNYDHVVPRVRGGQTVWENIVTSCYGCNDRKGSRTPAEAGMKLLRKPVKPKTSRSRPHFASSPRGSRWYGSRIASRSGEAGSALAADIMIGPKTLRVGLEGRSRWTRGA